MIAAAAQKPVAESAFSTPLTGTPAWRQIPAWDLVTTADLTSRTGKQATAVKQK